MKKLALCLSMILYGIINLSAQIKFEPGYFIDNDGNRVECEIQNYGWKNSPKRIIYHLPPADKSLELKMSDMQEFGITDCCKYIRYEGEVDQSSDNNHEVTYAKTPDWAYDTVFLEVLLEGAASLYVLERSGTQRFFYRVEGQDIAQLAYKRYLQNDGISFGVNEAFKNQISQDLKSDKITINRIKDLRYEERSLLSLFKDYNEDLGGSIVSDFVNRKPKVRISISPRVGIEIATMEVENRNAANTYANLGQHKMLRIGLEAEVVLPFHQNKVGVIVEPVYSYYKGVNMDNVLAGTGEIDYTAIECPVGLRYYMFLSPDTKVFINGVANFEIVPKKDKVNQQMVAARGTVLVLDSSINAAFGMGLKLKDTISLECRYRLGKNVLGSYLYWKTDFPALSFMMGFTL